ncbi:unnamed protein product [Cuscuta campestris]|uniref:Uncharacterized protein n=1 Tax=Cuscuta campestris TaxID=132261 RepID=A0A484M8E6_9ASTE|nr:unnamed protein product [Cuscuta campestris]
MDEPEGAAAAKNSEETLMVNMDRAEDESDVMFEVKGSEVFVDGDSLNKADSEFRSGDLDGGSNLMAKDDNGKEI